MFLPLSSLTLSPSNKSRYALSKICGEKTARTFARRFKSDIYALRIGNVIEPHEYTTLFPAFLDNPASRKRNAWSYIDARDLGQICDLAIKKSGLGFQVFNATNDTITVRGGTKEFLEKEGGGVRVTRVVSETCFVNLRIVLSRECLP